LGLVTLAGGRLKNKAARSGLAGANLTGCRFLPGGRDHGLPNRLHLAPRPADAPLIC